MWKTANTIILNLQDNPRQTRDSKMNETKPKKLVSRNVSFALGIICIALVAGLVGSVLSYSSRISSLNSKLNDLNYNINLAKSTEWVENQIVSQPAGAYSSWVFQAQYAGYIAVWLFSDTNETYLRVIYTSRVMSLISYDNQVNVGTNDTVLFPILPSNGIEIRVGNNNALNNATETIAYIKYYY